MENIDAQVDSHYGFGSIMDKIEAGLQAAGKDILHLCVDDLAPIDAFHTRGRASTLEVAEMAGVSADDSVLDVGCGLGGTARYLAQQVGCQVTGLDLTEEYVSVGKQLNDLVGLSSKVKMVQGSALELPFQENHFDVVWTEHAQMNIADKETFYSEIARVLKPGGRFLFHDIFRGSGDHPVYPAPWAEDESISALATVSETQDAMQDAGLKLSHWHGKVDESIAFFKEVAAKIGLDGPPPIGIHLLMGDNASIKLQNYVTNMTEQRVTVAMGMALKK